jgi:hypothetical protein
METLQHKFVSSIPDQIDELTLYITMEYRTAIHKCICGCGNEVITPFSTTDWELNFNGDSVSLSPSIGNWSFKCQSHYWIVKNKIIHASKWDKDEIAYNRKTDKKKKVEFYSKKILQESEVDEQLIVLDEFSKSVSKWNTFKKFITDLL